MIVDTNQFFKCETCTHSRIGTCTTHCDAGESYTPNVYKLVALNDGDLLDRETVIQNVLDQMKMSSNPELVKERILNLQGISAQKRAQWHDAIYSEEDFFTGECREWNYYVCSNCMNESSTATPYCSNCGAKMEDK